MVSLPVAYRGGVKRVAAVLACLVPVTVAVAGCGGSSSDSVANPAPKPVPTLTCPKDTPTPAPSASAAVARALRSVPFDLPMPDNISVVDVTKTSDGIQVVKFTTPTSMRDTVLFIVDKYPKAGYVLGRGDAEATEADAPFVKGRLRGLTRVASLNQCQTLWLVATIATSGSNGGTSPLLSPHPTSSQTSALPFG
jgi:hypothetical protein